VRGETEMLTAKEVEVVLTAALAAPYEARLSCGCGRAYVAADAAWSAELKRIFGKHAGDARYTDRGKGETGSDLRRLHDAARAANAAWGPVSRRLAGVTT